MNRPSIVVLVGAALALGLPTADLHFGAAHASPKKGAAQPAARRGGKEARAEEPGARGRGGQLRVPRGFRRWRPHGRLRELARGFKPVFRAADRAFAQATLARARTIARMPNAQLARMSIATLARVLFVLDTGADSGAFRKKVAGLTKERRGEAVRVGDDVFAQFEF